MVVAVGRRRDIGTILIVLIPALSIEAELAKLVTLWLRRSWAYAHQLTPKPIL